MHGGNNQNFLSIEDLLNIEKIVETFENVKKQISNETNKDTNNKELFSILKEEIDEEDLIKYINKFQQYKEFFAENLDKSVFTTEIIQKILNKSEFMILNSDDNYFKAYYKDEVNSLIIKKNIFKEFDYNYMIYLRDRALTRHKITDNILSNDNEKNNEFTKNLEEEEKRIEENNKLFIEYVHQINELLKLLTKISKKGFIYYFLEDENILIKENKNIISYFNKIEEINDLLLLKIKVKIEKEKIKGEAESYISKFYICGEEKKDFNQAYDLINNIYKNIIKVQIKAYKQKKYIKFIYGRQFHLFLDYFINKRKNDNLDYFLCYFTNNEKIKIKDLNKIMI